jgi:hypothetical protein
VATDDLQILVTGQAAAPAHFNISGTGQIRPKTIFATFNGSGAAGAFLPALKIVSDGGETVGIYPTDTSVAAGASADVTWFPGVTPAASSSGSGIQFDTDPQNGTFLFVETTGSNPDLSDSSIQFENSGNDGIQLLDEGAGGISLASTADGGIVVQNSGVGGSGMQIEQLGTGGGLTIRNTGSNGIAITDTSGAGLNITQLGSGGMDLTDNGVGGLYLDANSTGGIHINDTGGGGVFITGLPAAMPGGSKQLWTNGGVLNITP